MRNSPIIVSTSFCECVSCLCVVRRWSLQLGRTFADCGPPSLPTAKEEEEEDRVVVTAVAVGDHPTIVTMSPILIHLTLSLLPSPPTLHHTFQQQLPSVFSTTAEHLIST